MAPLCKLARLCRAFYAAASSFVVNLGVFSPVELAVCCVTSVLQFLQHCCTMLHCVSIFGAHDEPGVSRFIVVIKIGNY